MDHKGWTHKESLIQSAHCTVNSQVYCFYGLTYTESKSGQYGGIVVEAAEIDVHILLTNQ